VTVLDNFANSSPEALKRVESLTGRRIKVHKGDIRDGALLRNIMQGSDFDTVLHFAGLKAVSDSVARPLDYYEVNLGGSVTLARAMSDAGVFRLVFSSTASVYGDQADMPLTEASALGLAASPYGGPSGWSNRCSRSQIRDGELRRCDISIRWGSSSGRINEITARRQPCSICDAGCRWPTIDPVGFGDDTARRNRHA
jgi:nucleoside-diphosphate-sugar epimerase